MSSVYEFTLKVCSSLDTLTYNPEDPDLKRVNPESQQDSPMSIRLVADSSTTFTLNL